MEYPLARAGMCQKATLMELGGEFLEFSTQPTVSTETVRLMGWCVFGMLPVWLDWGE